MSYEDLEGKLEDIAAIEKSLTKEIEELIIRRFAEIDVDVSADKLAGVEDIISDAVYSEVQSIEAELEDAPLPRSDFEEHSVLWNVL